MSDQKRHPFSFTLGPGPYQWVGTFDLGQCLAALSSGNVNGYNSGMQSAPKLESGLGTCAHCGHDITMIFIVKTGEGKLFGVGCDCIMKTGGEGDFSNLSEVERKVKQIKREKARDRRDKKRDERLEAEKVEFDSLFPKVKDLLNKHDSIFASFPHPHPYYASQGKTFKDYAGWFLDNSRPSLSGLKMFHEKILEKIK